MSKLKYMYINLYVIIYTHMSSKDIVFIETVQETEKPSENKS